MAVLRVALMVFALCMVLFTVLSTFGINKERGLFGYKFYIVLSNSMQGVFSVGDVVASKVVDIQTLESGDIITFKSMDSMNYGAVITHKIRSVVTSDGMPAFVTYGVATDVDDSVPVPAENILGEYSFKVPQAGFVLSYLKTPVGYFLLILLPFIGLISFEAINFIRLFRQYKRELEAEAVERDSVLETERSKTEAMERELAELRIALAKRDEVVPADADKSPSGNGDS